MPFTNNTAVRLRSAQFLPITRALAVQQPARCPEAANSPFFCMIVSVLLCVLAIKALPQISSRGNALDVVKDGPASLPSATVDLRVPKQAGKVTTVTAGADLQDALNHAGCGDMLRLAATATFTGNYTLPAKNCTSTSWIMVRSDADDSALPAFGNRLKPSQASRLAKIISPNDRPAIRADSNARFYWITLVEIGVGPRVSHNDGVVIVGNHDKSTSSMPGHIVIDRCYIHGNHSGDIRRGVVANGMAIAVTNSHIEEFHDRGVDTQAVLAYNSPGPLLIENNLLSAAGENMMIGGADPDVPNLVNSDITIRGNSLSKPLAWKRDDPAYGGILWSVKNLLELKNAQRVLIEGNVLENNWAQAQNGFAVLFTPRNQSAGCGWCTVADITFRYNILRHSGSGFNISGADSKGGGAGPSQPAQRIAIHDNLLSDINGPAWGNADGKLFQIVSTGALDVHDVTIDHNTCISQSGAIITSGEPGHSTAHFVYTNNIASHNLYGVIGTGTGAGNSTLKRYFPGAVFTRNIIEALPASMAAGEYPPGNFFPSSWSAVRFLDYAGSNFRLRRTSPFHGAGSDHRDVGADIARLNAMVGTH